MTVTGSLALDRLSDAELVECLGAGAIDPETFGAEVARREQAEQARAAREQARKVARMRWQDAAHAQYLEASAACKGVLLSARGKLHGPADDFGLWSGEWRDVERYASEELLLWFAEPGHERLTFQLWQRQGSQAAAKRLARDERDLAAMDAAPKTTAPAMSKAQVDRFTAALAANSARAARPAPRPGSIARYMVRLEEFTARVNSMAGRLEAMLPASKTTQSHQ